jgi:hypothetical protein
VPAPQTRLDRWLKAPIDRVDGEKAVRIQVHKAVLTLVALASPALVAGCGANGGEHQRKTLERVSADATSSTGASAEAGHRTEPGSNSNSCAGSAGALSSGSSACSSNSDARLVVAAAQRYIHALMNRNWAEACSLLSDEAKSQILANDPVRARLYRSEGRRLTCALELTLYVSSTDLSGLSKAHVSLESLFGDNATVRWTAGSTLTPLIKSGGRWLIGTSVHERAQIPPREGPVPEAVSASAFEAKLKAGRLSEATIDVERHTVTAYGLYAGHIITQIAPGTEPDLRAELRASRVRLTFMTRALERETPRSDSQAWRSSRPAKEPTTNAARSTGS